MHRLCVEWQVYPSVCNTQPSSEEVHTETPTTHSQKKKKKKEETLLQWGEQYSAYLVIFLLHASSRCDNFPTVFTTILRGCIWMKGDAQHRDKHTRGNRGNDKKGCFATRKRKVHVSHMLFWCNVNTLAHFHTQSYPISHAKYHAYLQRKFTTHTNKANVRHETRRDLILKASPSPCLSPTALGLPLKHTRTSMFELTDPPVYTVSPNSLWVLLSSTVDLH